MRRGSRCAVVVAGSAAFLLAAAPPLSAAGFGLFEQGARAMGMAGAFTAQADDGSAMFHNVAGLGFQRQTDYTLGATLIRPIEAEFEGLPPFPGPGLATAQKDQLFVLPHFYWVRPLGERVTFGLGLNSPFGLTTEWDADTFPGRFISTLAQLRVFDLNPSVAWRVSDTFSVGLGAVARYSDVELERRVPAINPFRQTVFDAAAVHLQSDLDNGFGWNVGILHRPSDTFSWGLSYRSSIQVDYGGSGRFTQISSGNPQLDAVVAAQIPFDRDLPVKTGIDFPAMASLGVAFHFAEAAVLEVDVNWTGWSSFDVVRLDFPDNPSFSSVLPQGYDDAYNYRVGLAFGDEGEWRVGVVYDETPQPDESVGPLLPDANRVGYTFGYGWNERLDLAVMLLGFEKRTTTTNRDSFFGRYDTEAVLISATVRW